MTHVACFSKKRFSSYSNQHFRLFTGYASSSAGGAGLYNTASDQNYGSKYPYSNQYTGYASAGGSGNAFPFASPYAPLPPFATPYDFQNAFQQYYNQLSAFNAKYGQIIHDRFCCCTALCSPVNQTFEISVVKINSWGLLC